MQDREQIIINDYINNDPLSEENLDKTLKYVNKISLSLPNKTIWLYTGFKWEQILYPIVTGDFNPKRNEMLSKRRQIMEQCDILIDGRYIESQRNPSLHWKGSSNQRVIDVQESLRKNKVVLYCD